MRWTLPPLLEIVSEPDLQNAEEAVAFARELHALCVFLGVTGGVMQKGHMRFEPNINVVITLDDGREVASRDLQGLEGGASR